MLPGLLSQRPTLLSEVLVHAGDILLHLGDRVCHLANLLPERLALRPQLLVNSSGLLESGSATIGTDIPSNPRRDSARATQISADPATAATRTDRPCRTRPPNPAPGREDRSAGGTRDQDRHP
jgi:hypothetical protein